MKKVTHYFSSIFFYFGYIFLYLPIFLVAIYSFNKASTIKWEAFSFFWYIKLFSNRTLLNSIIISLKVAFVSATLSVMIGTLCAHAWARKKSPHRLLGALSTTPLVIPEIVMGLALLMVFVSIQRFTGWIQKGIMPIIFAHTTLGISYVTILARTQLMNLDPILEEAALDLGAPPSKVFFLITLPLIFPSLISGWLIAFILSLDDVVLASFTSGPESSTLPVFIFSSLHLGATPQLNALATCMILLATFFVLSAEYSIRRYKKINKTKQ